MALCGIALGGNIGDIAGTFQSALSLLARHDLNPLEVSDFIRTPPMGRDAGDGFLNAAATARTELSAAEILSRLHTVERALGRSRSVHWGPRTVDLDLIFLDDLVVDSPNLVLPHPCVWYRAFVMQPLNQIAPDWIHPVLKESTSSLRERLLERPIRLDIAQNANVDGDGLCRLLTEQYESPEFSFQLAQRATEADTRATAFATIEFRPHNGSSDSRTQPHHELSRRIVMEVPALSAAHIPESHVCASVQELMAAINATRTSS